MRNEIMSEIKRQDRCEISPEVVPMGAHSFLWCVLLFSNNVFSDEIDCTSLTEHQLMEKNAVLRNCMNKTVLGISPHILYDYFVYFTDDEHNALFRTVEEFRNSFSIAWRNSTHLAFPELRSISCNDSRRGFTIVGNPYLVEVSFPQLKQFRGIRYLEVYGNPRLLNTTIAHLRGLNIDGGTDFTGSMIRGSGDCAFHRPVKSAAELSGCTHISSGWNAYLHEPYLLSPSFTGVVDTVIRGSDDCISVYNTSISDLSFFNFTTRGKDWDNCIHYITNNRNLCTASIEQMFSALNATVEIHDNKDPAECNAASSTTNTTVAPPTSTTSNPPTTPAVHHYRGNITFEMALQQID